MTQPVRTLRRSPQDKKVAGVCAALARYAGVDPVLVRLAFVLLTFVGGTGLLLYVVAWVIVPKARSGQALAPAAAPAPPSTILGIIGVVIGAAVVFGDWSFGPRNGLLPLLLIGGGVALLLRRDDLPAANQSGTRQPGAPPVWGVPDGAGMTDARSGAAPTAAVGAPGGPVWGGTIPDGTVPGGTIPNSTLPEGTEPPEVPAWASDWYRAQTEARAELGLPPLPPPGFDEPGRPVAPAAGRPRRRWRGVLVVFVVGLLVLFAAAAAGLGAMLSGGAGERAYRPTSWDAVQGRYELGVGELVLDLSALPALDASRSVSVDVGMGHAQVIVPEGVDIDFGGHAGMGEVIPPTGPADAQDGIDVTVSTLVEARREPAPSTTTSTVQGAGSDRAAGGAGDSATDDADRPVLHLDAEVGLGLVEIIRR
ncbi:MAG: PspC domain-containing protein [Acidimicrobiales bacterium]|nr:PspC domain-containing protein [Acidimicrobiales bacterium]